MGLDYSINLICKIVDKNTGEVDDECTFEICYWRKCWHLSWIIHNFAKISNHVIKIDDDFSVTCKPEILPEVEHLILDELRNYNSASWYDSLWGAVHCRQITYKQLDYLTLFRELLKRQDNGEINDLAIIRELDLILNDENITGTDYNEAEYLKDLISNYYWSDIDYKLSHTIEYEIEFINSY